MAKIFDWKEKIKKNELEYTIDVLKNDGIIIFPTDTVYGVGGSCFSEKAIQKIFDIKFRPEDKPINVLTDTFAKFEKVAQKITDKEKEIIQNYMPGALTIILDKKREVPNLLTANLQTVGIRIPKNKIAIEILKTLENPLGVTSVNISGEKPGLELSDFIDQFEDKVDIIIDGGKVDIGVASTIVRVKENVEILRQGSVKLQ